MREAFSAWKRFSADRRGVVSFEYVLVALAVVVAVAAIFGSGSGGGLTTSLTDAIAALTAVFTAGVGG